VVLQQNPDCLSPHPQHQFSLDGFFRDEAHGPPCLAFRRFAADHGYNALLLRGVEQWGGTGARLVIQRTLQSSLLVTMSDPSDGLCSQLDVVGNLRGGRSLGEVEEG